MPKYSFIVPVYGCEKYLEACVGSILSQQGGHDFEVILVDDGAKDGSGRIADALSLKDSRVRTFHKENGGAASARNYGLRQAQGRYILFIDGDDTVEDRLLQEVEAALAQHPDALVIFGMAFDYYQKESIHHQECLSCKHTGSYFRQDFLENFQSFFDDNALSSACNKVFRADFIKENDLLFQESMNLYEDFDFVVSYLCAVTKIFLIDKPCYHYRLHREDNHLYKLVKNIENLKGNMLALEASMQKLQAVDTEKREIMRVYANLNISLLSLHLFVNKHSYRELSASLDYYFSGLDFNMLLTQDCVYGKATKKLVNQIRNRKYFSVWLEYQKRRSISGAKKVVKKLLKR